MDNQFALKLIAALEKQKSKRQINSDIKDLEGIIRKLSVVATFAKGDSKRELNQFIAQMSNQLGHIKLKAKIEGEQVKQEINTALQGITYKDIEIVADTKTDSIKLKVRKAVEEARRYTSKNPVPINLELKKDILNNQLTTFLNKNSKIKESSALLGEADQLRSLFGQISDQQSLKSATGQFQLFKSEVVATGYGTKSTTDKVKSLLSNITKVGSAFGLARMGITKYKESLGNLKEIDTVLTEISKTSEMTKRQLAELGDESFVTANKYGQLAKNYLLGVQEMARSGYEDKSKELGELSVLAQSAGDMTAEMANNFILATDAAFQYKGNIEQLTAALDGVNYISNKNSASLTDLADGIRVSASYAAGAGVNIDQLAAAEGTMIAVTKRSGSEMGRAFRSILLNLQKVSGEFDGEVIDEEQLQKVEARCHSLGVELETLKNGVATLRNPMEVLKELADVYNSLPDSSADKQGLISDLGGKYHANALSSLLKRWDLYEKMLSEFSQGSGSALAEASKTADSWQGRLNQLQNDWDGFVNSITSESAIKGGITFLGSTIQGFQKLTDTLGTIPVMITAVNTAMTALNKDYGITQVVNKDTKKLDIQGNMFGIDFTAIKAQKRHFTEAAEAIGEWNKILANGKNNIEDFGTNIVKNNAQFKEYLKTCSKDAPASLEGYKSYLNAAGVSTDELRLKTILLNSALTLGLSIAVQAVVTGITKVANAEKEFEERSKELAANFRSAESSINDYKKRIVELQEVTNDSASSISEVTAARQELMEIQDELIQKFGTEKEVIDIVTEAINGQADALDGLSSKKYQEWKNSFNDKPFAQQAQDWMSSDNFGQGMSRLLDLDFGGAWEEFTEPTESNISKMVRAMQGAYYELEKTGVATLDKLIEETYNLQSTSDGTKFILGGYLDDVYETVLEIQGLANGFDVPASVGANLEKIANSAKKTLDTYADDYDIYVAYEKILGKQYDSQLKAIEEARGKYEEAVNRKDSLQIRSSGENFASLLTQAMDTAAQNNDFGVARYFESLYPEMQEIVSKWNFKVDFEGDTDALKSSVIDSLEGLEGLSYEEISGLNLNAATPEQIQGWVSLNALAHDYQMTLAKLLQLLQDMGLVQSESYQQLAEKFGEQNVKTLPKEDLEIAYTVSDGTIQSWDELAAAIEEFKAAAEDAGDSLSASLLSEDTLKTLSEYKSNLSTLQGLLSDIAKGSFDPSKEVEALNLIAGMMPEFNLELYRAADGTINFASALDDLAGQSMQALIAKCPEAAMQARNLYNQMAGSEHAVKGAVSAYYDIVSVLERVRDGESLTAQEIARLIAKHSELSTQLVITAEGFSIEEEALVSLARQMAGSANDSISTQITLTKAIMEACYLRVKAYGIEAQAFDKMANRYASAATPAEKKAQEQMIANATEGMGKDAAPAIIGAVRDYSKAAGEMLAFEKQLEEMSGNVASRLGGFSTSSPGGSASKSAASGFKGQIDWVAESIASLTDEIGRLDSSLKNAEQYSARLGWSDKLIKKNKQLAATYRQASAAYKEEFSKSASGLPKKYVSAIKGGNTFKVEDFSGKGGEKTYNKIQEVIAAWRNYQKALADEQGAWEAVADAVMGKASLVQEAYGDRLDNIAKRKGILENEVAALEAKGLGVSAKYYKELAALEEERRKKLAEEKSGLEQGFSDAVASGAIKKYSDEWFQYVGIIQGINLEIQNSGNSITELSNAIRSLKWDSFDTLLGKFTAITDEVNFLLGHMGDFDMVDSDGNYTKEGLATLGLHSQNYQIHSSNAAKYKGEADSLAGAKDSESIARREELLGLYRDSITAAQEERRAMVGLAQEGIQAQIDSMGELIGKKKEALQAEKELEDYRESIAEKQKSVTDIEKAMAALSGDDSEEAKSKLRKLRSDLKDAQKDLSGTEKDYAYKEKGKGLDELLTSYTSNMEALMGDTGKLFTDTMALVGENASVIGQTLGQVAQGLGYEITSSVSSAWEAAGASASGYATTMDTVSARIHATLGSITAQWEKVTKAADKAAAAQLGALGSKGNYTSGVSDPIASSTASNGAAAMASGAASGASAATSAMKAQVMALLKDKSNHSKNAVSKGDEAYQKLSGVNKAIVDAGYTNLSYSGAAKLAALLGLGNVKGADMVGNEDLKKKMLDKLMGLGLQGFSTGGVIKTYTGEDGLLLAQKGESVMSKEATALLRELSIAAPAFMRPTTPQFEQAPSQGGQNVTVSEGAFHFDMPNVVDAQGMVRELQNDRRLQKAVKQVVFGEGLGDGRLGVNRI